MVNIRGDIKSILGEMFRYFVNIIRQLTVPEVDTSLGLSIKAYPEGLPEGYALIRRPRLVSTEGTVGCIMCAMNFVAMYP